RSLKIAGVCGFCFSHGSINMRVPPGDMISNAAWPSHVTWHGFLSVCLCGYAPVQKTLANSNIRIAQNWVSLVILAPEGSVFLDKNSPCYKRHVRGLSQRC